MKFKESKSATAENVEPPLPYLVKHVRGICWNLAREEKTVQDMRMLILKVVCL